MLKKSFSLVLCALTWALSSSAVWAQDWPSKPMRMVVPYQAGGGVDAAARLLAQHLTSALGQTMVVEAKPGGGTVIGAETVARAAPDGYTFLLTGGSTMSLLPLTHPGKLPFDPLTDFAPVGMVSRMPFFVFASTNTSFGTLKDLMNEAKTKNGQLAFASNGIGSMSHLGSLTLAQSANADMIHVPYQGFAPAISDLVSGRVAMVMSDLAPVKAQLQAGTLRTLAVASPNRSRFAPDAPTLAEAGYPGHEFEIWLALYAPAKTPPAIVARISAEMKKFLELPSTREAYSKLGHESDGAGPDVVRKRIESELKSMLPVVKSAGLLNK